MTDLIIYVVIASILDLFIVQVLIPNFFTYQVLEIWNKLPENIICAPNLMLFKCHLKEFNLGSIVALEFN